MPAKILVPYDGSAPSEKAIMYVIKALKEGTNSKKRSVILIHVVSEIPVPLFIDNRIRSSRTGEEITLTEYMKEIYQQMKDAVGKKLESKKIELERALDLQDITVEVRVVIGNPPDKILECAKDEMVDQIVIGSTSLKGFAAKLKALGSVSRKVAEQACCPVVIVH